MLKKNSMKKPKGIANYNLRTKKYTNIFDYFKPKKEKTDKPKVTVAFRCDVTTQQEILRLSKKAEITLSEWISIVVEDAIIKKVLKKLYLKITNYI